MLNSPDLMGEVHLPSGEFEGPFAVNKPCRVIGNKTTLWGGHGAVLTVNAPDVALKDLRVEITNDSLSAAKSIAIDSKMRDTAFDNVEIIGGALGIDGEEKTWGIPKSIDLGKIPAERECFFRLEVIVPVRTEVISLCHDITITPQFLEEGENEVILSCSPIRSGSYIYGELLFRSEIIRRVYLSGSVEENVPSFENGGTVFKANPREMAEEELTRETESPSYEEIIYPDMADASAEESETHRSETGDEAEESPLQSLYIIERGMHIKIPSPKAEIELIYDNRDFPMDIDAFAFMTDSHGIVRQNDRFVFFGNDHSGCGSVKYLFAPDKKAVFIDFDAIPIDVAGIDIAYSIYENPTGLNFSNLINPAISVRFSESHTLIYPLVPPLNENTVVGISITFEKSGWNLAPLGMIYRRGLSDLCENYGLKIN